MCCQAVVERLALRGGRSRRDRPHLPNFAFDPPVNAWLRCALNFLGSMFGTIRRHQSWLLIVIMSITIISFLYWGIDRPTRGGRGGRSAKGPVINGKTV